MTDTPITDLTGPELSAAVAREVMGWVERISAGYLGPTPMWCDSNGQAIVHCGLWRPHSDHNDLHRVIERMVERGHRWKISGWSFGIVAAFSNGGDWIDAADEKSINTAVLRACLAAVRSESDG